MANIVCPYCGHIPFKTEKGLAWHLEHIHGVSLDKSENIGQDSPDVSALRLQLSEYEVEHLHYMIPVENCQSILDNGILSFNRAEEIEHINLASSSVQRQRDKIVIDFDKHIHDYVPLYFATHTPMQYVWTQSSSKKGPVLKQEELIFIDLDAFQTLQIQEILITDGNAAAADTNFYGTPIDLSVLDWKIIKTQDCYSPEYKRKKSAEVLVPDCVPAKYFSRVVVCSNDIAKRLRRTKNVSLRHLRIVVDPDYYYQCS